jgi:hypothetical protein
MNPRVFLDVDPRTLRAPGSRRSGADPFKLRRQIAQFGDSVQGMPTFEVSRGTDGELVINNGVTRGFQGYEPAVQPTCQPKKKPPGRDLTPAENERNRKLSAIRIRVEHGFAGVKRCRSAKDVLRNTKPATSDEVIEAACGVHNLRVQSRKRSAK